jgi:glutathione S-transferase
MNDFALPALITLLTLLLLFGSAVHVGRMRGKHRVQPPATTGHPEFERAYRIQMNSTESALLFLPALWLAALYWNPQPAAVAGAVWLIGRLWYAIGYAQAAERRGRGFLLALLAWAALLLLATLGIGRTLLS